MISLDDFKMFLDSKGFSYNMTDDGKGIIFAFSTDTIPEKVVSIVFIEQYQVTISLKAFYLGTEITREIKDVINSFNRDLMYYAFYHENGYLWMRCNGIIEGNRTFEEINTLILAGYKIADAIYPKFQRILCK